MFGIPIIFDTFALKIRSFRDWYKKKETWKKYPINEKFTAFAVSLITVVTI